MGWLDWLVPASCLSCNRTGSWLCVDCRGGQLPSCRELPSGLTVIAAAGPTLLPAVTRWKDGAVRAATAELAELLVTAVSAAGWQPEICVPVPARRAAVSRRGWQPVAELTAHTARGLGGEVVDLLAFARQPRDQRGLADAERAANLAAAFRARPDRRTALIVDDVLTFGATLSAAETALRSAGVNVIGAAVLAVSRNRSACR